MIVPGGFPVLWERGAGKGERPSVKEKPGKKTGTKAGSFFFS